MPAPQAPPPVGPETPRMPTQFSGPAYLTPTPATSPGSAQYGPLGYHYQHYPHAGSVEPFHAHGNEHFGPPMAGAPQVHQPESYSFAVPPRASVEAPMITEESRKRSVDGDANTNSVATPKRVRADETVPTVPTVDGGTHIS